MKNYLLLIVLGILLGCGSGSGSSSSETNSLTTLFYLSKKVESIKSIRELPSAEEIVATYIYDKENNLIEVIKLFSRSRYLYNSDNVQTVNMEGRVTDTEGDMPKVSIKTNKTIYSEDGSVDRINHYLSKNPSTYDENLNGTRFGAHTSTTNYVYDDNRKLLRTETFHNQFQRIQSSVMFTYDEHDNLIEEIKCDFPNSCSSQSQYTWTRLDGELPTSFYLSRKDEDGVITEYDERNNLIYQKTRTDPDFERWFFDDSNRIIQTAVGDFDSDFGITNYHIRTKKFIYSEDGYLINVDHYNANDRLIYENYPYNGIGELRYITHYQYDDSNNAIMEEMIDTSSGATISKVVREFGNSNKILKEELFSRSLSLIKTTTYSYNEDNNLVEKIETRPQQSIIRTRYTWAEL